MEFVMVPVPADRVEEVYRLLAGPRATAAAPAEHPARSVPTDAGHSQPSDRIVGAAEGWTPELLQHFFAHSTPQQKRCFRFLSARPEARLSLEEVSAGIGYGGKQIGGMLGGAAKRARGYSLGVPWGWQHEGSTWLYFMPQRYADVIAAIPEAE